MTYIYDSERELHGRHAEFTKRLQALEAGVMTDERGFAYTEPERQKEWFREQLELIEAELHVRPDRPSPVMSPFRRLF